MNKENNGAINVALIGYGYAGKTFHAPLMANSPNLNLKAIVSSDSGKVHKDFAYIEILPKPEDAFVKQEIDLVMLATPNDTHFELAMRALQAGKHVVVDKPFTTTVDEAATLASLAKEKNLILSVFQNRRWDADFLTVRQLISTEKLGEIVSFHSSFDRYRPEVKQRWREQNIPGGGLWYDIGSHLVDQVVSLFGAPSTVYADFAMQRPSATAIDYFHVLLNYEKMLVILEAGSLVSSDTARFAIHGTAGSFIKYGKDVQESDLKKGINIKESLWGVDPEQGSFFQWQKESLTTELITNIPGDYAYYYEAIYQAILNGAPNPVTLDDALIVMNVIELAIKSAESGQRLKFDKFASFDRKAYK